jgi:hypothetical protein
VGVSTTLFADRCDPASDVRAVGVRAMIVGAAVQAGVLDKWRKDDGLDDKVFEVAATCSITLMPDGLDLRDFNEALGLRPDES